MSSSNDREVSLKLTGDVSGLKGALNSAEQDFLDLAKVGKSISVLEKAEANVRSFEGELQAATGKVRSLQTALSEAYAADADAPLLKKLNSELGYAEKAALRAGDALQKSQAAVVRLNLDAERTGVSLSTLASRKAELAVQTEKLTGRMGGLRQQLVEAAEAEARLGSGARSVSAAFNTINIRSAETIKSDITAINNALGTLARNTSLSGAEFDRAYASAQVRLAALRAELTGTEAAAGKTSTTVARLGTSLKGLAAPIAGAAIAQGFIQANVAGESLERTLVQLTGSGEAAAAEVDYLKTTANRLGLSVNDASRAYISLSAAAKGTALEGAGTRQVFEAVAGSMAKLGKSSADTEGALQAVSQMMSKGVVSMEEWRQQLGERLPGAAQATADAAGLTVEQLNKMIASGKTLSTDLLPLLAVGLEKMYGTAGKAEGAVAAWNRLKNAVSETFTMVGNSGVWQGTITALGWVNEAVRGLTGAFELLGKSIGITLAAIATFDFRHPIESVKRWKSAVVEAGDEIEARQKRIGAATAKANAEQEKQAQDEKRRTAETAEAAAMKLQLQAAYESLEESAKAGVEQAVKSAAARAEEGKASVDLANALGTESEKRIAALNSAKTDADALRGVADARRNEAEVSRAYADSLKALAGAEAQWTEAKRLAIAESEKEAALRAADADKAAAESIRAQQRAAQLATETEMLKDNSGRLVELKAAVDAAAVALENMRKLREQGVATAQQMVGAEIAAAQAAALYRDALHDQTEKIGQNLALTQSKISVEQAGVRLAIEQQRTILEVARARGDEHGAVQALLEIKLLEIRLAELTAQAKQAEAEASLLTAKAKREELQASGQLTAAKEAELKAMEAGAQVKQIEAQIANETAGRMRELAETFVQSGTAADAAAGSIQGIGNAARASADGVDDLIGSLRGLASAQQSVSNVRTSGPFPASPLGEIRASGVLLDPRAEALKAGATAANVDEMTRAIQIEVERLIALNGGMIPILRDLQSAVPAGINQYNASKAAPQPQSQPVAIKINLGGATKTVNAVSQSDADNLTSLLRLIESDMARAS